jgi:MOSC domain-containing protein
VPEVAALYRYPLKGFTPESRETLEVRPDGGVAGDRVLALRFADDPTPDDQWSRKQSLLVLMNTPGLARLQVGFDENARRLRVALDGSTLVDESIDGPGRLLIAAAIQAFAVEQEETPLRRESGHLPLRLVGDGVTPRFTDSPERGLSLHGRGSLAAISKALGDPALSELRFRSNIAVEGLEAWEEMGWEGRGLRIGEMAFDVARAKVRCLATQANPATGERDQPVLTTLTRAFAQEHPTFAIGIRARGPGILHTGDRVEVI